ncbi:hypothetical protein INS49_004638 [Diaporthe citri]|uniref:uncharacterized protein n=1 Tax=Diaporthe citri TaxID=83186 RepID=UPI001C80A8DC|nr:uncharacterized protein INS49_004638 [Diaporthe citri]KAG6354620.1 hypothetical protein INS49_004638 [Diaporthe citri]
MTTVKAQSDSSDLMSSGAKPDSMIGAANQDIEASPQMEGSQGKEPSKCRPRIRYRTELRHRVTGDLIHRSDSDKPQQRELRVENQDNQPIFELITRYETGGSKLEQAREALQEPSEGQLLDSAPSYSLRIYSSAILNALRSVVQYYPSQDLTGSTIEIKWPYPILVHHYDVLQKFRANCDAKDPDELCAREKDASAHIAHLLRFLDDNIMERVWAEEERVKKGFHTFDNLWINFKPGSTVLFRTLQSEWEAMVVSHVTGGIYQNPTAPWKVNGWQLEFDGKYLGRRVGEITPFPFDGEKSFKVDTIFVPDRDRIENEEAEKLINYGKILLTVIKMTDEMNSEWLHVKNFYAPEFQNDMIEDLVMDQARIKMLKALAKSYIRVNKRGDQIEHEPWAADFVKGKRNGLIFLLHGKPGVGKTVTAESIAEYTKRPLMIITSSDIGTNPSIVEANLTGSFKLAKSWGAVILIDEADVFMERRGPADLERNSLVAGFLRALEFYDGILFLTTNRIGAFDDAFISRIHVQLFYPDFTDDERQQVWMTFMQKLTKDRGKFMRISMDAKDYIRGNEVRSVKWNGREIRNAFQTAVSLAEYEDERDEEGKILLTDEHLRSVVELSRDFKDYLSKLHKGDEEKRALRRYERLDT